MYEEKVQNIAGEPEKPNADTSTQQTECTKGMYLEGHQTACEAKTIDSICWAGEAPHKVRMCGSQGEHAHTGHVNPCVCVFMFGESIQIFTYEQFRAMWGFTPGRQRSIDHR